MIASGEYWLGIDPGGAKNFGVAFLFEDAKTVTHCVSCADEAIALVAKKPLAAGIDAPLWWSSGKSSERIADRWIRKTHKIHPGTVQTANSLRGAALVQAAMFIFRLREKFPEVRITEAHPKALALAFGGWDFIQTKFGFISQKTDHERDAILAAIAAREGFSGKWAKNLADDRDASEQDPKNYWLKPIDYFWPDAL